MANPMPMMMQMAVTARHEHFTPPAFQASPMFHARVSPRIMHAAAMASRSSPGVMEERETTVRHHPRPASNTHWRHRQPTKTTRPRKTPDYKTPLETHNQNVALTI